MASSRVAILGGGLAGLAAGIRLHEAGFAVTLIEKRNVLGGRASSFCPPGETEPIDNCQHVLLGCCTNLLDFFSRTGALRHLEFYRRFDFLGSNGIASLAAAPLPAPFHFLPSLMRFRHLSRGDRVALVRALLAILRTPPPFPDTSLMTWLRIQKQSHEVIENFWRPIMTSALNEDPERLSLRPAFHVILDSFVRNRRGHTMAIPKVPLSTMYAIETMQRFMTIRLGEAASSFSSANGAIAGIVLQGGELVEADYFLSAVPPDALAKLFEATAGISWPGLAELKQLEWAPITGIHLWYDRPVMQLPHVVVLGKTIQWVFNKSPWKRPPADGEQYIQLVVSASRAQMAMKRNEILDLVQSELHDILPATTRAKLTRAVVVKESESTPHFPPGTDAMRPSATTLYRNLFVAGDWTATGWPPTMESAVRSGYQAAECIAAAAGLQRKFLVPDLRTSALARVLLR